MTSTHVLVQYIQAYIQALLTQLEHAQGDKHARPVNFTGQTASI